LTGEQENRRLQFDVILFSCSPVENVVSRLRMDGELTGRIIGCGLIVHTGLRSGYLESVYQRALAYELEDRGMHVEREVRFQVRWRDRVVGEYVADLIVERRVIVETKAVIALSRAHDAQLVNYLTATGIDDGLLLNFGAPQLQVRRKYRIYKPRGT
jgi:GxxExxY protein